MKQNYLTLLLFLLSTPALALGVQLKFEPTESYFSRITYSVGEYFEPHFLKVEADLFRNKEMKIYQEACGSGLDLLELKRTTNGAIDEVKVKILNGDEVITENVGASFFTLKHDATGRLSQLENGTDRYTVEKLENSKAKWWVYTQSPTNLKRVYHIFKYNTPEDALKGYKHLLKQSTSTSVSINTIDQKISRVTIVRYQSVTTLLPHQLANIDGEYAQELYRIVKGAGYMDGYKTTCVYKL